MTIVLNENEWAEEMIRQKSLGKKPFETLSRVARYYLDKKYPKGKVRVLLDTFLVQCDPTASLPKWSKTLDAALKRALKYEAIQIDGIDITKPEMDKILGLKGKQLMRFAFTLLCLAKYWNIINPANDSWVNCEDREIMKMANINTSIKRQSLMFHTLRECGMIQFSKKVDNTNVRVCFVEDGDVVIRITDFRNIGYQLLKYLGEPYFECVNCGIVTKINNPSRGARQKYCKDCAAEIALKQRVDSVMRQRRKKYESVQNESVEI